MRFQDPRVTSFRWLIGTGMMLHLFQLQGEDRVHDTAMMWERYLITPGWHQFLPWWIPFALTFSLVPAGLWLAWRRSHRSEGLLSALYVAHYVTYPFRIRNHMTTVLMGMTVPWVLRLVGRGRDRRQVEDAVARGLAAVCCVIYLSAAFHKCNNAFLSGDPDRSPGSDGWMQFWWALGLPGDAPGWQLWMAGWGTVVLEALLPPLVWWLPRWRAHLTTALLLFHVPIVTVLWIPDYPWLAAAFFPCLWGAEQVAAIHRHLGPSRWTLAGAALGVFTEFWLIPSIGPFTIAGAVVLGAWGWILGAVWKTERTPRLQGAAPAAA